VIHVAVSARWRSTRLHRSSDRGRRV
jgi:hypothetical protein